MNVTIDHDIRVIDSYGYNRLHNENFNFMRVIESQEIEVLNREFNFSEYNALLNGGIQGNNTINACCPTVRYLNKINENFTFIGNIRLTSYEITNSTSGSYISFFHQFRMV